MAQGKSISTSAAGCAPAPRTSRPCGASVTA